MRGVAALAVLALHVCKLFNFGYLPRLAHLSVDFFFLLSGFVIATAYEARLAAGWPLPAFAVRRLVRLYPMVLVGASLGLVTLLLRHFANHDLSYLGIALAAVPNLALLPSPALLSFRAFGFPLNSPFWSLSAEWMVNLAYAATVRWWRGWRLAAAILITAAAMVAIAVSHGGLDVGFNWDDYPLAVVRAAFSFLVGVALNHGFGKLQPARGAFEVVVVVLGLVLFSPISGGPWLDLLLAMGVFPLMIIAGVRARTPAWLNRPWTALGELSYPLYAVHYPIVVAFAQISKGRHLQGAAQIGLAVLCAAVALTFAQLMLMGFDRPLRARLQVALAARGRASAVPSPSGV